jgi:hypothetical protein
VPLTIYRRHLDTCKHAGKPRRDAWSQKCSCPLWVQGSLGGEYLRRSLDLVSWEAAQDRVRGWEASGEIGVIKTDVPDIAAAVERFFEDIKSRGLSEATIGKQNVLLRKQLLPWCKSRGFYSLTRCLKTATGARLQSTLIVPTWLPPPSEPAIARSPAYDTSDRRACVNAAALTVTDASCYEARKLPATRSCGDSSPGSASPRPSA